MPGYTLVPVDYQPDFSDYSLVPVDYDPFADEGVTQVAQAQPLQTQVTGSPQPPANIAAPPNASCANR